jgi:hypothetical protein
MMMDRSEQRNLVLAPLNQADAGPHQGALEYRLFPAKLPRSRERTPVVRRDFPPSARSNALRHTTQKHQVDEYETNSYKRL